MRDDGVLGRQWEEAMWNKHGSIVQEECVVTVCLSGRFPRTECGSGKDGVRTFVGSCAGKSVREGGQGPRGDISA